MEMKFLVYGFDSTDMRMGVHRESQGPHGCAGERVCPLAREQDLGTSLSPNLMSQVEKDCHWD